MLPWLLPRVHVAACPFRVRGPLRPLRRKKAKASDSEWYRTTDGEVSRE